MLNDFSTIKLEPPKTAFPAPAQAPNAPSASASAAAAAASSEDDSILSEEEFAKQLQAGMADLLGELEKSVGDHLSRQPGTQHLASAVLTQPPQPEMQAQFESIFKELSTAAEQASAAAPSEASASTAGPTPAPGPAPSFQETIRRTMERMQTSGEQATAAAAAGGASDDFLAELLRQMQSGGLDGAGSEEEFSKMLMGMMEQLTNKEILYEPMKELDDKFPEWMEKNKDKTPAEDMKRYEEQRTLVHEIVLKFEEASYSDANPADREYIIDRMQKVWMRRRVRSSVLKLTVPAHLDASDRVPTVGPRRRHAVSSGRAEHARRRLQSPMTV
jgi:peroxin-19